jgi:hypothetical protein
MYCTLTERPKAEALKPDASPVMDEPPTAAEAEAPPCWKMAVRLTSSSEARSPALLGGERQGVKSR